MLEEEEAVGAPGSQQRLVLPLICCCVNASDGPASPAQEQPRVRDSFMSHSRSQPLLPSLPLPCDGAVPWGRQGWCVLSACVRAWAVAVWMLSGVGAASDVLPE